LTYQVTVARRAHGSNRHQEALIAKVMLVAIARGPSLGQTDLLPRGLDLLCTAASALGVLPAEGIVLFIV
jgi:hypothetical protein